MNQSSQRLTPPSRTDSPPSDDGDGGDGQSADNTPASNSSDNTMPTSATAPRTKTSKATPAPSEGKRLIRTIRPIDVRKLQESGLDRKIAEALSKQKQQQTKFTNTTVMGTKVPTASKGSISNATIPSNHIKFMKPVATLNSPTASTSSPAFTLNQTSVTSFKPLPATSPPVPQQMTSASSPSAVVAAPPKLLTKKSIIPPKITITGPEAPTDRDRQQMKDLNAEQRMKHVKNLLHRKLLQRQLASATEDRPKLFAHLKPPSNESEKTPPLKSKGNKKLLIFPAQTPPPVPDNRISANDDQITQRITTKPRPKQQLSQLDQEMSYSKHWEPLCDVLKDPAKSTAIAACSNVDQQYSQTSPVNVRSQPPHQRNQDINCNKPCVPLYNMPVSSYTTVDKQLPQMSPIYVRSSYQQPAQRGQEVLPTKQWGPVIVRNSSQHLHNKSYGQLLYNMPKLLEKADTGTYPNNTDKQLPQTPPVNIRNPEESGERTPTNKLTTKPKTPQKSPQDIARKLDFQSDEQPKVPQYERISANNISANLVHDVVYDKDPSSVNEIPKASIKPVYTPTSFGHDTLGKHRIVIPDVSPLKTPFPSANIPHEAPLPTIDTFKKPYPLQGVNYYHMSPQPSTTGSGPHTGYITTNYNIHQSSAAATSTHSIQHRVQNNYNVTPVVTINTPTAPNSLIVLENKVLSQDEMIDLTALRLSTSKIDAPQRFARPHKPIPEVVIKQEKPDDFPTSSPTENIQEKPIVYRIAEKQTDTTTKGLVFISSKQNKKVIVNAAKLKLPPEKIADLAKKIAESQSLTAERRKEEAILPNHTVPPEAEMQNKTGVQYSPVQQSINNEQPSGVSDKIQQKTPPRFINSVANVGQYGQKFFLIVKKDPMVSKKVIPKPKSATVYEISPMTSSHIVQTSSPKQGKQTKKESTINKSDMEASTLSYTPIKNRKSAVEIIDEPEAEQSSFSAVDFIASLASTNPITEDTQLELSPEELNLNASCAMNFSPLRIPFSPLKIKVSTPNQPLLQVVATAPPEAINEFYNENSVEIGNIVTLREDSNVVNIDPQNVSMSTEIVDTIVIESSRGRDHVLRKSVDNKMSIINTTSCKLKPIKVANVLDSYQSDLQKTKNIDGNKTSVQSKEFKESVETSETIKQTSGEIEKHMLSKTATADNVCEAGLDVSITNRSAHREQETNEVSEGVHDHKTNSSSIQFGSKDSHENIVTAPLEHDKGETVEICPDLAVEETSQNLSNKTENLEKCVNTEHKKAVVSSQILQNYPTNIAEKSLEIATKEKVEDSNYFAPSKIFTPPTDDPTKQLKEHVAETIETTKSQPIVDHVSTIEESLHTTDNSGSLISILKTNSSGEDTETNLDETVPKTNESSEMYVVKSIKDTHKLKVEESSPTMAGPSKRVSRFKKGKINLVQRNKPSTANSKSVSTTHTLDTTDTPKSSESKMGPKPKTVESSLVLTATSSSSDVRPAECVNETTNDPPFSNKAVDQSISEIRTECKEIPTAMKSYAEIKKTECKKIQTQVLVKELNLAPEINNLPESNQPSISETISHDTETNDIDLENNKNVPEDIDKSDTCTKPLENTTGTISVSQQYTKGTPESNSPFSKSDVTDYIMDISIETSQVDISQLINPPKMPKRNSNIKKSKDIPGESPVPTPKDMKHVTISLVDIVKNPPSEMPGTSPQLPFKRKFEKKDQKSDDIIGIRSLLGKIVMSEADVEECGSDKESRMEEHKQNDAQLASHADAKDTESGCHEENCRREEQEHNESQLASRKLSTEDVGDKSTESLVAKEAKEKQDTVNVAYKAQKEENDAHKNDNDNTEFDLGVTMAEVESPKKDLAEERKIDGIDTISRRSKSEGDFKSADDIDLPKSDAEQLSSKQDSISDSSKQPYLPSPIRSRRSTKLGLDSAIECNTNTPSNITRRCSTRYQKTTEDILDIFPAATDTKSLKKQRKSLSEHNANDNEQIGSTKDKENQISSKIDGNSPRSSETEERSGQTLFDKVKKSEIETSKIDHFKCGGDAAAPTKRIRLCSKTYDVDPFTQSALDKSTSPPNPMDVEDSCHDSPQDHKPLGSPNQRKRLRKTLEDIKKSHKLDTDSEDDCDFDSTTNECVGPRDFLGFDNNTKGSEESQNPQEITEDGKSPTKAATTKGGTLKNWLTTGKAISPTPTQDGVLKRLRHAKKSAPIQGIPLKKRWDASTKAQEETDITDDTSPADDEDAENCRQVQRRKRYLKIVIDSNKDLIKTKRFKLSDSDDITKYHTFVEPKPVETRTRISETDSDTPACSGRRSKRARRRLISDDVEEKGDNKETLGLEQKNTSNETSNSKQPETAVVRLSNINSDEPKNKQTSTKANKSIDSEEHAALTDDKVNFSSEETSSADKPTEESVLDVKKTSVKSLKSKNLVRNPLHRQVEKKESNPAIKEDQDKHTPKTKLRVTPKSRLSRQLKIEEYDGDDCKKEVRKNEDPIIEPTTKARRIYKRKHKIEESAKEEISEDLKDDTEEIGTKISNRQNNNLEPTSNPRLQQTNIEDSTEHSQDEKSNIPESCAPETPTSAKVGRGKYKRRPTPENQFNPRLLLITKREQLETDEILTEAKPGPGPIQCGLCMMRTTEAKWDIHLAEHYGVGWKLGDEELNIHYRPSVINIITAYLKDTQIKGLQCRMCQKLYRSGLGLLMHLEVCGAGKQRADCDYCHKNYSILSLPSHLRACPERSKQFNQKQDTQEIKEEVFSATGRTKRSSTIKAESKLKQMGAELGQTAEDAQDFNPKDHIKYNAPLGDDVRQKWSSDIIKFSKAFCPKKTCPYTSDNIDELEEHIKDCKFVMKIGYYCKYCKRRCFATEKEAISHINTVHRNGKDFSGSDSDCNIKTDDEQSSNDDDLSEGVDENETDDNDLDSSGKCDSIGRKKKVRQYKVTTTSKSNATPAAIMRKRIFPRRRRESTNAFVLQKWKNFLKVNYSPEPLFNNFKCQYSVLKTQQYIKYLPNQEMSMKFSTTKDAKLPAILGEPQSNIEWNQLGRYKAINHETDAFLFLGAPVTCCSWLPLPAHVEEQYLLVAYRRDMFKFVKFLNPKHVNTSLILFKVTQLKNDGVKRVHIEVHYAVAIEDGPVYNVSFIPSGGYNLEDNRLGLVAVASVESLVKVYALPIEVTKDCDEKSGGIPLIEKEPSFVLSIDVTTTSDTTKREHVLMNPQCLQVSWSEFSGHNHIFASFSNGFIGIWDVTNDPQENLNRFNVENVIHYAPMNYFYVGEKGIKHFALHYDSNGPRWLAVSSFYRKFVIYDIRNFMQPTPLKEDMARNVIRCLDWCPLWEPVLIGYCDSIPNNGRCIQCISPANVMYHQQKLDNMNSAVTAIHYTPCTNTCVASVDNGDVLFMDCREFHYEQPMGRTFGERRILSAMDIKQLNEKPIERLTKPSNNQQLENEWTMYEYDYKEKYGLVFKPLTKLKDSTKDTFFNVNRRAPLNITPFMRINALRCNLNKTAKRLVAVGYENGFIRVIYFDKESKFRKR